MVDLPACQNTWVRGRQVWTTRRGCERLLDHGLCLGERDPTSKAPSTAGLISGLAGLGHLWMAQSEAKSRSRGQKGQDPADP